MSKRVKAGRVRACPPAAPLVAPVLPVPVEPY